MKQREIAIENAFCRQCRKLGIWQIKLGQDSMPDRGVLLPGGNLVLIEFKRKGAQPRPNQAATIKKLRNIGYKVYVIDDSEDAIALAKELANG